MKRADYLFLLSLLLMTAAAEPVPFSSMLAQPEQAASFEQSALGKAVAAQEKEMGLLFSVCRLSEDWAVVCTDSGSGVHVVTLYVMARTAGEWQCLLKPRYNTDDARKLPQSAELTEEGCLRILGAEGLVIFAMEL